MARPIARFKLTFSGDASTSGQFAYFPTNTNWGVDPRNDEIESVTNVDEWIIIAQFSSGSMAGGVQIVASHSGDYGGTWANVGSALAWGAASSEVYAAVSGVFPALGVKISSTVTGGTVAVYVVGMGSGST